MLKKTILFGLSVALIAGSTVYYTNSQIPLASRLLNEQTAPVSGELSINISKGDGRSIKSMSLRLGDTGKLFLIAKNSGGAKVPVTIDTADRSNIYFQQFNPNTVKADEFTFQARKLGSYEYTLSITDGGKSLSKTIQFIIRPALNINNTGLQSCDFPDTDSVLVRDFCQKGIINGYPDGTFRPGTIVNRAEMMKIAYQLFGDQKELDETAMSLKSSNTFSFVDVEPNHWAAPYIAIAKNLGKIQGYANGTFVPFQDVKRAEAWKMMIEAATTGDVVLQAAFDASKTLTRDSAWFGPYAQFGKTIGMHIPGEGVTPDWLLMADPINRLEVVEFMTKIINFIPTESVILEP